MSATTAARPPVTVVSLGGTIASAGSEDSTLAGPRLSADQLVRAVPELAELATVSVVDPLRLPSCDLTVDVARTVAAAARDAVAGGARGVVVTQGTDTLEEMSFCLDLLLDLRAPVVVTGAMRHAGLPGADGPANLLDAVRVAVSDEARGVGVLVVFEEQVHTPIALRKSHTSSPAAFNSGELGPLGWVAEGRPHLRDRPFPRVHVAGTAGDLPRVALVKVVLGDDGWWLEPVRKHTVGLVLEGMGGGHLPGWLAERVEDLTARMPVVMTSRTGGGEVLTSTYGGFPGSEASLIAAGVLPGGMLSGPQARVLLSLLLATGADLPAIAEALTLMGRPSRRSLRTDIITIGGRTAEPVMNGRLG